MDGPCKMPYSPVVLQCSYIKLISLTQSIRACNVDRLLAVPTAVCAAGVAIVF